MRSAKKGKALIISIYRFEVKWLGDLTGYKQDKQKLSDLFEQMGFDVYYPSNRDDNLDLTKEV